MEQTVCSVEETGACAANFVRRLKEDRGGRKHATVVGLSGDLGAGKTAFVKAVAKALGVEETVTSPTFVIEKIYKLRGQAFERLVHIDAYRLLSADELRALGWDDIVVEPNNLIMVEWPENVAEMIPKGAVTARFEVSGEGERKIVFS